MTIVTTIRTMLIPLAAAGLVCAVTACGGEDEPSTTTTTTSTSETCRTNHFCVNDACECTTAGKNGQSCTDDDACKNECEVCS